MLEWLVTYGVTILAWLGATILFGLLIGSLRLGVGWPTQYGLRRLGALALIGSAVLLGTLRGGPGGKTAERQELDPDHEVDLSSSDVSRLRQPWDAFGDPRWPVAETLAEVCDVSYQAPVFARDAFKEMGFSRCETITDGSMVGYLVSHEDVAVVVFRGTDMHEWSDWGVNKAIRSVPTDHGGVHSGFSDAYDRMADQVDELLSRIKPSHLWLTGHSLGGALATVAAYRIESRGDDSVAGLITFGQPMVAKEDLAIHLDRLFDGRYAWIVNNQDVVPKSPPRYEPAGRLVHLNGTGSPGFWRREVRVYSSAPGNASADEGPIGPPLPPLTERERQLLLDQIDPETPPRDSDGPVVYSSSYVPEISDHYMDAYLSSLRSLLGVQLE